MRGHLRPWLTTTHNTCARSFDIPAGPVVLCECGFCFFFCGSSRLLLCGGLVGRRDAVNIIIIMPNAGARFSIYVV